VLSLRGQPLPYVRLSHLFSLDADAAARQSVVVVDHGGARVGLVVDELFGEGQAVIKPLGKVFRDLPGISGSTILGNGRVALIVDMAAAAAAAGLAHTAAPA
jgi:two-component system chemotaxis sensor kinase CheA